METANQRMAGPARTLVPAIATLALLGGGCSVKKFAVRQVGDALSSGTSVYETDPDVDLIGDALPFSLKLVESLLEITPRNRGLLLTAARGFTLYSFAYVDAPGEILIEDDFAQGKALRERARRLYLRAFGYGLRALETAYPGIAEEFARTPREAAGRVSAKRIELLYWAGAALGLAVATDPADATLLARLAEVRAMIDRAMELDESWDEGSLHEFRLKLELAKPGGGDPEVIERSFRRALELSRGQRAGLYVAYAEAAGIPAQDRALFEEMLGKALAIDADAHARYRLLNHIAQRRARWLQARVDDLFL